jgi:amidophosphoribosyltransferase
VVLQVCEVLGADGLVYQDVSALLDVGKELNPTVDEFDAACFTGHYVTGDIDAEYLDALEKSGRGANRRRAGQRASLLAAV